MQVKDNMISSYHAWIFYQTEPNTQIKHELSIVLSYIVFVTARQKKRSLESYQQKTVEWSEDFGAERRSKNLFFMELNSMQMCPKY